MKTMIAVIALMLSSAAIAQTCTTYYDANKQRHCSICIAPGGTPVVTCY